jgi:hypothetical protein
MKSNRLYFIRIAVTTFLFLTLMGLPSAQADHYKLDFKGSCSFTLDALSYGSLTATVKQFHGKAFPEGKKYSCSYSSRDDFVWIYNCGGSARLYLGGYTWGEFEIGSRRVKCELKIL